jgi:hypothetical protein
MPKAPQIATLDQFKDRYDQGLPVKLPGCGLVIRMRGIGFDHMIRVGKLPDPLMPFVAKQMSVLLDPAVPEKPKPLNEQLLAYVDFIDAMIEESVIEPKGLKADYLQPVDQQMILSGLYSPIEQISVSSFRNDTESMESVYADPEV